MSQEEWSCPDPRCPKKTFKTPAALTSHNKSKHQNETIAQPKQTTASKPSVKNLDARLNKIEGEMNDRLANLEKDNANLKKRLSDVEDENEIMVEVLGLQYLTPLPPNSEENVKQFCVSAKPSDDEKSTIDSVFRHVESGLMQSNYHYHPRLDIQKIVQGGSTAQGTSVKGRFDLDVVVFVKDFASQKMDIYKKEAKSRLSDRGFTWLRETPAASVYKYEGVEIDVLFTGQYKGTAPITYGDEATRLHMASLTEKQVKYVKDNTGPIEIECIRGIKKCIKTGAWAGLKPPSSYLIAVLVIHVRNEWLRTSKTRHVYRVLPDCNKNRQVLFGYVIKCLTNLGAAEIKMDEQTKPPSITKPSVLDPVNEHNNLLSALKPRTIALIVKSGVGEYL
eukprot:m.271508 g.271508  ORF g.271508 m.271508 type:complete len:392 (-) comp96056_c0_seq1:159-1334(-)